MTTETEIYVGEIEDLLDDALDFDGERPLAYEELARRLQEDEERTLALISRRMQALIARKEPLDRQRDAMLDHYRAQAAPILSQIEYLSQVVAETLLARRRRNPEVKSLTLLGLGEWKSRKVGDGWDVDEKATLEKLNADEKAQFVEDRPHLKGKDFRAHLDSLVTPVKHGLSDVPAEERTERMLAVIEAIEEQYGVTYRPERISVKGPLD